MNQAFEFAPGGPRPLGESGEPVIIPAAQAIAAFRAQAPAETPVARLPGEKPRAKANPLDRITRKSFLPELRARLRVVETEIRRMRGLEDEAAELKRLIAAAKAPPAGVTDISTARKSG